MTLRQDILATVAYFDIFNYPITQTEIYLFLKNSYEHEPFSEELKDLVLQGYLHKLDEFYSLQKNHALAERRKAGNQHARKMMAIAEKAASIIIRFPYVRGIAVSGSLSKNYADEHSDIDFFIITAKNRLWIARTLLHFFKKFTFLINKQHYFCMNYFVDEAQMEIEEKNIYTAIEVATLLPLRGIETFGAFYSRNDWTHSYLPNHSMKVSYLRAPKRHLFKRAFEWLFTGKTGDLVESLCMRITAHRWNKKEEQEQKNAHGITLSMIASKHCAKPNPFYFQSKIILKYEHKLYNISRRTEILLKPVV